MDDFAELPPKPSKASKVFALVACVLALFGLVLPIPGFWELYNIPAGTACRPMLQAASILFVGLGTPAIVLPFAIVAACERGSSRMVGLLAIALSILPFPVYFFLFHWIMDAHALTAKP